MRKVHGAALFQEFMLPSVFLGTETRREQKAGYRPILPACARELSSSALGFEQEIPS
jgi:hypothetical protein